MRRIVLFVSVLMSLPVMPAIAGGDENLACSMMKRGRFKSLDIAGEGFYFVIEGNSHTEYMGDPKTYVRSSLSWVSPCQYQLRITEITFVNPLLKPGTVMTVNINGFENGRISLETLIDGNPYSGKVVKLK